MTQIQENLLRKCSNAFKGVRRNMLEGAAMLNEIEQTGAWELHYSSFGEYIESECQMSRSAASKLLQTYKFYVLDNKFPPSELENVSHESLYSALRLPGTAEEKLVKAQTLSRSELRTELKDPDEKCLHEDSYKICTACHKRI